MTFTLVGFIALEPEQNKDDAAISTLNTSTERVSFNSGTGRMMFKCPEPGCTRQYTSRFSLKYHHEASHGPIEAVKQTFTCDDCDEVFRYSRALDLHRKREHPKGKQFFMCTEPGCDKAYSRKCHLERHMSYSHGPGSAKVQCTECSYVARDKYHLKQHWSTKHDPEYLKNKKTKELKRIKERKKKKPAVEQSLIKSKFWRVITMIT